MKIYRGFRDADGNCVVTVEERLEPTVTTPPRRLNPRHDLYNHSPDGFEWGYHGSGPSQLALALCADVHGDEVAQGIYQTFKTQVVSKLPHSGWTLTDDQIRNPIPVPDPLQRAPVAGDMVVVEGGRFRGCILTYIRPDALLGHFCEHSQYPGGLRVPAVSLAKSQLELDAKKNL